MKNSTPLQNETIVFTGTLKSEEPLRRVRSLGGRAVSCPLIETKSIHTEQDVAYMKRCMTATWLIFTSQSSVRAFEEKMKMLKIVATDFQGKIAAIGTKTANALEKIGFTVSFIPETFSADVFVKQFRPRKEEQVDVVFLRGTLARSLLRDQLPFTVHEWTVYETVPTDRAFDTLREIIRTERNVTILFASPSAVKQFETFQFPTTFRIGAIGHVTARALRSYGRPVDYMPSTYTLLALVEEIVQAKGSL